MCFLCLLWLDLFGDSHGNYHWDVFPVTSVLIAVRADEISFFKLNRQEDVCSRGDGKDEMRDRHRWRRPEGKQPAEIERMTNVAIEDRGSEF